MGNLKNLIVFIHPSKTFFRDEYDLMAKIQIDNCLSLGWKKDDILFITNFPWEHSGIKTILVGDEHDCRVRPRSIKTAILPYLIDEGIIERGKIYWNHDLDAYQMNPITEEELDLVNYDVGLTDYGWRDRWCLGSYFVKDTARDIFELAKPIIYRDIEDETAMMELTQNEAINKRCKRMNITYNLGMRNVESNYEKATKPIKVVHFHPGETRVPALDIFLHGKNKLNMPILNERLAQVFGTHGLK